MANGTNTTTTTTTSQTNQTKDKPKETSKAEQCRAKGGRWDEASQTCTMPEEEKQTDVKTRRDLPEKKIDFKGDGVTYTLGDRTFNLSKEEYDVLKGKGGKITPQTEEIKRMEQVRESALIQIKEREAGEIKEEGRALAFPEEAEQEKAIEEERARLIEEETPERRELFPGKPELEKTAVVGGTFGAIRQLFEETIMPALPEGEYKELIEKNQLLEGTEELRNLALTEIQRQELSRGLTQSEKFGRLIEGIPVVGSLASKFAGGLIETPSKNVEEIVTNVRKEKRRISNIETNVRYGYLPVETAQEQIADIENNIQRLESRIQLLVLNSPELKFNSDRVNTIETEILLAREKVFQAKLNILQGKSIEPTDEDILFAIQNLQEEAGDGAFEFQ